MEHPFDLQGAKEIFKDPIKPIEPIATTLALGEEGGDDSFVTSRAIGEEGGADDPIVTTQALGEEGGDGPIVTTLAIGEEGGDDPIATTQALGEEGGDGPIVTTLALGEEGGDGPDITTLAIGEEGGDVGDDILVTIRIPDDLKPRREDRLDRVLERVQSVFGDKAVSDENNGFRDITLEGPLSKRETVRWNRLLKRMKRILGPDNVIEALNNGPGRGHPFDLPPIATLEQPLLGANPLQSQPLLLEDEPSVIATGLQDPPGL